MKSLVLLTLLVCSLFAHKVNLFIVSENDTINIYSYFANGNPCKNCKLIIKNDDTIILEDTLDNKGKYNYKTKYKNIEVTVDASSGHIVKEKITVENLTEENLQEHKEKEKALEYQKIALGLFILFVFFFLLKRFTR